jgi:hypothetical protein
LTAHRVASRKSRAAVATVVVACCLAGCAGPEEQINSAVQQSYSAVQSARLVVRLTLGKKSTVAVTGTALKDALKELDSAETTVTSAPVDSQAASEQKRSLDAIRRSIDAVNDAQRALSRGALNDAYAGLNTAARALKRAATASGKPVAGADGQ